MCDRTDRNGEILVSVSWRTGACSPSKAGSQHQPDDGWVRRGRAGTRAVGVWRSKSKPTPGQGRRLLDRLTAHDADCLSAVKQTETQQMAVTERVSVCFVYTICEGHALDGTRQESPGRKVAERWGLRSPRSSRQVLCPRPIRQTRLGALGEEAKWSRADEHTVACTVYVLYSKASVTRRSVA